MNASRRQTGQITIALLLECANSGTIGDEAHLAITDTLVHLQREEFHQLRAQEKYEHTSTSNATQVAICRVALPALEAAVDAWNRDDFDTVIDQLKIAITADGKPKKPTRRGKRK